VGLKYVEADFLTRTGTINLLFYPTAFTHALEITQPPIQAVLCSAGGRPYSWGVKCPVRDLTTHFHLVLRLRMPGTVSTLPNMP